MADTKRSSQIPVMSPRSSSLSSPLGLVPPSRYPSVSGSPTLPTPSPSASSNGGGSTPFRSFRNFLSFGGGRHSSNPSVSALPKGPFTGLGPVRRSVNVERRVSSPQLNSRRSEDDYVLSIDFPRPGGDKSTHTPRSQKSDPGLEPPRTPLSQMSHSSRSESPNSDTLGMSLAQCHWPPSYLRNRSLTSGTRASRDRAVYYSRVRDFRDLEAFAKLGYLPS